MRWTDKKYVLFPVSRLGWIMVCVICFFAGACREDSISSSEPLSTSSPAEIQTPPLHNWPLPRSDERLTERREMVRVIRDSYGFNNPAVLEAMEQVPRHWFVRQQEQAMAYADTPLPIGHDQTISQPYIVAYMTGILALTPDQKVLEIGTGSGYQAAVLAEFTPHVYSIEIVEPLGQTAARRLARLGYTTIKTKIGDGYLGWPEHAPFDAIIVTCAPDHIPPALVEQLKPGGRICIPVGGEYQLQKLVLVTKNQDGTLTQKSLMSVRFVPLLRDTK
ncbi:MAG: protein-L-isoaspartate(D-aspartate) O-methyltransferase [Sedimentisphaerales bacterium]|nr:protein-L-isoaspartate(D-aspartate) O-methyltransferase [Sedimentisphaerales bacterium]